MLPVLYATQLMMLKIKMKVKSIMVELLWLKSSLYISESASLQLPLANLC